EWPLVVATLLSGTPDLGFVVAGNGVAGRLAVSAQQPPRLEMFFDKAADASRVRAVDFRVLRDLTDGLPRTGRGSGRLCKVAGYGSHQTLAVMDECLPDIAQVVAGPVGKGLIRNGNQAAIKLAFRRFGQSGHIGNLQWPGDEIINLLARRG